MTLIVSACMSDKVNIGRFDLESSELAIRSSMHRIGGKMLEKILDLDDGCDEVRSIDGDDGRSYQFVEVREKKLVSVLGPIKIRRAYYYDPLSKEGCCPKDAALDVVGTSFTPGIRRIMGRVGAYRPFGLGHEDIREISGIEVGAKEIERCSNRLGESVEEFFQKDSSLIDADNVIPFSKSSVFYVSMDGTGVPVVKAETRNRKGKGADGAAKTREVKLGCVFTQTTVDDKDRPVRDEHSTSYVGAIETAEEFSKRIYAEAFRRGVEKAENVCIVGDGARWIWNIAEEHFYGATQIIDLYHAREHYWNIARMAYSRDGGRLKQWTNKRRKELDRGRVDLVVKAMEKLSIANKTDTETVLREINYFKNNELRMQYADFKKRGFFVGSGVMEAGCRSVIGQRLKQSGMHWSVQGANNIIALRCCFFSNRWEDFWEYRVLA